MSVVEPYPAATDLAWAAGFWDGEGSVGRYRIGQKGTPDGYVLASLPQKDRRVLDHLQSILPFGRIHRKSTIDGWQFNVSRQLDVMLLSFMLWPYLGEMKREQFAQALDWKAD